MMLQLKRVMVIAIVAGQVAVAPVAHLVLVLTDSGDPVPAAGVT
jgi:hypothetical protein